MVAQHITDANYYPLPEDMDMKTRTEIEYRDFGADQVAKCEDGFPLDCFVLFEHEGETIINPFAYSDDPDTLFGIEKMTAWKAEAAALMAEWEADAA